MTHALNETHDVQAKSWVESANVDGASFPIQNLPFGVYCAESDSPRIGIAIGDSILDLYRAAESNKLLEGISNSTRGACRAQNLNDLMSLGLTHWSELRKCVFRLLQNSASREQQKSVAKMLISQGEVQMALPCQVGDYTDFYAGIFHAMNVGSLFRPQNPLLPNYKWIPIGYHGRSSSVVISGSPVRRPSGQTKVPDSDVPKFGLSRQLDYELELGLYIGSGNKLGEAISIDDAERHIFGLSLLNDWSARDIQSWEYQPLGPFLAKSFATTVSPWIITLEALAPFRCTPFERSADDPQPLPYLQSSVDQRTGGIEIFLEALLSTHEMRAAGIAPHVICRASSRDLYWTVSQLVAHHTSNGCNLRSGDLLGSGTISGRTRESSGSLLEMSQQGARPIELHNGQRRCYLESGDEIVIRGWCERDGHTSIGLGECRGRIEN